MKLAYTSPKMTVHGKVENLTQILGPDATKDSLIVNGDLIGTSDDSQSVTIGTDVTIN